MRLLDFTYDKTPPFLAGHQAASSLTLLLDHESALDAQLRALLRTGRDTDLRVMLPMVTRPEELVLVRDRLARAADAVGSDRLPAVGAMLELPVAIERLTELADVADFFSLGTNDLTASTLGLDRTDPRLTPAAAADPRVLRLVRAGGAASAARPAGRCRCAATPRPTRSRSRCCSAPACAPSASRRPGSTRSARWSADTPRHPVTTSSARRSVPMRERRSARATAPRSRDTARAVSTTARDSRALA